MSFKRLALYIAYICLTLIFLTNSGYSKSYYVKNGGNDSADGLSDSTAWKTIGKLNRTSFSNNDIIQLKSGNTWTDTTLTLDSTSVGTNGIIIKAYGSGAKPRIDGNYIRPIRIDHALVNLTVKDLDISGSDYGGTTDHRCSIQNVDGLTIDGVDYNGHTGSSTYNRFNVLSISWVDGTVEIKNCTIQNVMKDTFANTLSTWGSNDAHGILLWYGNTGGGPKDEGTVSIHDNTITNVYSDSIQIAGVQIVSSIYNNTLIGFGENAVDLKHSRYIDVYQNEISQNNIGAGVDSGWYGPSGVAAGSSTAFVGIYSQDNTIRENYFHTSEFAGVSIDGANWTVKNNYFKNLGLGVKLSATGAKVFNNLFNMATGTPTIEPYATRWVATFLSAIQVNAVSKSSGYIYNNTIYVSSSDHNYGIGYQTSASVSGIEIKNNVIQMTRSSSYVYPLYVQNASGAYPTVSNNVYYNANHSNRVYWKGAVYDNTELRAYESASGSLFCIFTDDPGLSNPEEGNLSISSALSAIVDKGVYLPLSELGLQNNSIWPNGVLTLNRNDYGYPDIGAYEYCDNCETSQLQPPKGLKLIAP